MNRILQRQLARIENLAAEHRYAALLDIVSATYDQHDRDRKQSDRANALMADELNEMISVREGAILLEAEKQAAVAANRAKSQFIANMSHELRTPLNAIIGYSEIIEDEYSSAGTQLLEDARRIQRSGRHLLGLINDILDHSKIEAGRLDLKRSTTRLLPLFQDVVEAVRPESMKNGNELIATCADDIGEAFVDPLRLRQCLLNLAGNAVKFTRNGRVTLDLRKTALGAAPAIQFRVSDTGIGMSEAVVARLFQPFVQADASTTRDFGGTGLGLAITKKLVNTMHGSVAVSSQEGVGSTFTITVPCARDLNDAEAA